MVDRVREFPAKVGEGELEDRGSRFIAWVFHSPDESQFLTELERIRELHPKARHHCWAWRMEGEYRFQDDGEPGGTAGRPMLQVLEGQGLDNAGAVCVRYFGGVKLGTGGLMRAYGGATARAAENAGRRFELLFRSGEFQLGFERLGVRTELEALFPESVLVGDYDDRGWTGQLRIPDQRSEELRTFLADRGLRWVGEDLTRE